MKDLTPVASDTLYSKRDEWPCCTETGTEPGATTALGDARFGLAERSGAEWDLMEAAPATDGRPEFARVDKVVDTAKHLKRSGREGDETEDFDGLHALGTLPDAK